ncbi:hypothetical protein ACYF6T_21335 [Streptomyces sp. 7R007]
MERKTRTRKATSAERHAARALGQPDPEEIEVNTTPTAELHAARLTEPKQSAKPAGMATAEWYGRSSQDGDDAA